MNDGYIPHGERIAKLMCGAAFTGVFLERRIKRLPVGARALLAHRLVDGDLAVSGFTKQQASLLVHVGVGSVALVARLSDAERLALKQGRVSLRQLRHQHQRLPSEVDIARFIARVGADRVQEVLSAFMPSPVTAAAE